MKIVDAIRTIKEFYKDYLSMGKDELADFYENKCDYYQKYVELCLFAGSFLFARGLFCALGMVVFPFLRLRKRSRDEKDGDNKH